MMEAEVCGIGCLRQPQASRRGALTSLKCRPDEKTTPSRISISPVVFPSPSTLQYR